MTRPVADILEQAEREGWPTSYIDAMANHHLCGGISRDYVNGCFEDPEPGALGSEPEALADPHQDAVPSGPVGAASALDDTHRRDSCVPTEQQKEQLAALIADRAAQGQSTDAFANLQEDIADTQAQQQD